MFPEPLLHVITERNECEPVGATFHLHGDGFAFIIESIYAYRIDAKNPTRGLGDIANLLGQLPEPLSTQYVDTPYLDELCEKYLILDYARREVTLRIDNYKPDRCTFDHENVKPLYELARAHNTDMYMQPPPLLERKVIRVISKRNGEYCSGMDILLPTDGNRILTNLLSLRDDGSVTAEILAQTLFHWEPPHVQIRPFQDALLGDEYENEVKPHFPSDHPFLTIDSPENSLRLSDSSGRLIMVVDVNEDSMNRIHERLIQPRRESIASSFLAAVPWTDSIPTSVKGPC